MTGVKARSSTFVKLGPSVRVRQPLTIETDARAGQADPSPPTQVFFGSPRPASHNASVPRPSPLFLPSSSPPNPRGGIFADAPSTLVKFLNRTSLPPSTSSRLPSQLFAHRPRRARGVKRLAGQPYRITSRQTLLPSSRICSRRSVGLSVAVAGADQARNNSSAHSSRAAVSRCVSSFSPPRPASRIELTLSIFDFSSSARHHSSLPLLAVTLTSSSPREWSRQPHKRQ